MKLKSRLQCSEESGLRSDLTEAGVVLAEGGGSQAGGETGQLERDPW